MRKRIIRDTFIADMMLAAHKRRVDEWEKECEEGIAKDKASAKAGDDTPADASSANYRRDDDDGSGGGGCADGPRQARESSAGAEDDQRSAPTMLKRSASEKKLWDQFRGARAASFSEEAKDGKFGADSPEKRWLLSAVGLAVAKEAEAKAAREDTAQAHRDDLDRPKAVSFQSEEPSAGRAVLPSRNRSFDALAAHASVDDAFDEDDEDMPISALSSRNSSPQLPCTSPRNLRSVQPTPSAAEALSWNEGHRCQRPSATRVRLE